jgi:ribosome maturation protein Sdo1
MGTANIKEADICHLERMVSYTCETREHRASVVVRENATAVARRKFNTMTRARTPQAKTHRGLEARVKLVQPRRGAHKPH